MTQYKEDLKIPEPILVGIHELFKISARVGYEVEGCEVRGCDGSIESRMACGVCDSCSACKVCEREYGLCEAAECCPLLVEVVTKGRTEITKEDCEMCGVRCNICNRCDRCNVCGECDKLDKGGNRKVIQQVGNKLNCPSYHDGHPGINPLELETRDIIHVCYDMSCGPEIVTSPRNPKRAEEIVEGVIEACKSNNIRLSPLDKAGGHITASFIGIFPRVVVGNVIQLTRKWYIELEMLTCVPGTLSRDCMEMRYQYRKIPELPGWTKRDVFFTEKYSACHPKKEQALSLMPTLIEFRIPDTSDEARRWAWNTLVFLSMISNAFTLSKNGVLVLNQDQFNETVDIVNRTTPMGLHYKYDREKIEMFEKTRFDNRIDRRNEVIDELDFEAFAVNVAELREWAKKQPGLTMEIPPKINWKETEVCVV